MRPSSLQISSSITSKREIWGLFDGGGESDWAMFLLMQASTVLFLAKEIAETERKATKKMIMLMEVFIIAFGFSCCSMRESACTYGVKTCYRYLRLR